jgi:hypothetical protein
MRRTPPETSLVGRRDLILHAYDTFLTTQTRLFTLALSSFNAESTEIKQKQTLLVLDDLVVFAAMARRLVELTNLKQLSRELPVKLAFLDLREPKEVHRLNKTVWPAPGSEDTELGVLMGPEVRHGEAEVYARVQA